LGYEHFFETKPITGERLKENVSRYFSIEEAFALGFNRLALQPNGSTGYVTFDSRNTQYSLAAVLNLTPRDSKFRPYFLAGPALVQYTASGIPKQPSNATLFLQPGQQLH